MTGYQLGHQNEGKVLIVKFELSKSLCFGGCCPRSNAFHHDQMLHCEKKKVFFFYFLILEDQSPDAILSTY